MAKESKGWAFVGTIPILGFVLVYLAHKGDKYATYYAKQGLVLGIAGILISIALTILIITAPLALIWNLVVFVLWILSAMNSLSGKMKQTPLVGRFASKF